MAVNLSDSQSILDTYSSIVDDIYDNNWWDLSTFIVIRHEPEHLGCYSSTRTCVFDNSGVSHYVLELMSELLQTMYHQLSLTDCGSGGISELKNKIDDLEQVYIAFCREQVDLEPAFLLINYIPASVSGVKRGRYHDATVLGFLWTSFDPWLS